MKTAHPSHPSLDHSALGDRLRLARLARNLSLSQVAAKLKIRQSLLKAIEQGCYHILPETPYNLGFLHSYAKYLNLDDQQAIRELKHLLNADRPEKQLYFPPYISSSQSPSGLIILVSLLLSIVFYGSWYVFDIFKYNHPSSPVAVIISPESQPSIPPQAETHDTTQLPPSNPVERNTPLVPTDVQHSRGPASVSHALLTDNQTSPRLDNANSETLTDTNLQPVDQSPSETPLDSLDLEDDQSIISSSDTDTETHTTDQETSEQSISMLDIEALKQIPLPSQRNLEWVQLLEKPPSE